MFKVVAAFLLLTLITMASCSSNTKPRAHTPTPTPNALTENGSGLVLSSTAFKEGQAIPRQYTCDGVNISPPLEWTGAPKTAKTIAIIADDPDAPAGIWVHWVLYNVPAEYIGFVENVPASENLRGGGFQGKNDFGKIGYGGPCPPSGTHRYFFKIYAVDSELPLEAGATKADVEKAMQGHIVAQGQLMGTYSR